jgi:peptide/nickel transport system ATP-binding protein
MQVLIRADQVSRRFVKRSSYAERIAQMLGAKPASHTVHAVDTVNLEIHRGEVVGLVGESGCGKSTFGRMLAGVVPPSSGTIQVSNAGGADATVLGSRGRLAHRLATQMIFQDPMSSLNPRKRVREIIGEAPLVHGMVKRRDLDDYVVDVMERVGLNPDVRQRYPHQFSGGQRQRICIARALSLEPSLIVCDEPVSALDVSIQAQVINLLIDLQRKNNFSYLFIAHDLAVVAHISHRVAVMYLGRLVEIAEKRELFANPRHPYTQALLASVPVADPKARRLTPLIDGDVPSPINPPPGCAFHTRCRYVMDRCKIEAPKLADVGAQHEVACFLNEGTGRAN